MRILRINNKAELNAELEKLKVDPAGIELMLPKAFHLNIKVENLSAPAALILKQEMLSLGGDCANHRMVIKNAVEKADALLMGDLKLFRRLLPKLEKQPFGLKKISQELQNIIRDYPESPKYILNIGNKAYDLSERTYIMGILNVTPDSFSDGGSFLDTDNAISRGIQMVEEGADIIDLGAESTRPGAEPVALDDELNRIIPVLENLLKEVNVPISIDTYKSEVAEAALNAGAHIINDISGLRFDSRMKDIVAEANVPVVIMHIKGEPRNMQNNPFYDDLMGEIYNYFYESLEICQLAGIKHENIILDPGIGFGKRLADNYEILRRLGEFRSLNCPILVGTSRKSMIGNVLNLPSNQRLEGTAATVAISIQNGADIIRVHDVQAMKRVCEITDRLAGKICFE